MFTGIITDVGRVQSIERKGDIRLVIETAFDMASVDIGASIACSGVCLTVVDKDTGWFAADVSDETMNVTALNDWQVGSEINLERSLKMGDELGGHIVTGHVDTVGEIVVFDAVADSVQMDIKVPREFGKHVAKKGSVAIDGASLTVNDVTDLADGTVFSINLIPHTQSVTNFRQACVGKRVHVEMDILARYVARLMGNA